MQRIVINNVKHSSVMDHIYVNCPVNTLNLAIHTPPFGNHLLLNLYNQFKAINTQTNFQKKLEILQERETHKRTFTERLEYQK